MGLGSGADGGGENGMRNKRLHKKGYEGMKSIYFFANCSSRLTGGVCSGEI